MHFSTKILAIGAALFVLGIAGGFIRATRPVDRHMKVSLHLTPAYAISATV
jgi:hypothetical protein